MRRPADWLSLCGWVAVPLLAGAIGGAAAIEAPTFYDRLQRPGWAPPGWLFGPVWTLLYVLMGTAAWLVWRSPAAPLRNRALALFVAQLVPNAAWSWIFFRFRSGAFAFADCLLLWIAVALLCIAFARLRRAAGILVLPYWAWVSYALALTWTLWRANPGLL